MLRITISKCKDHPVYVLEGRLAGDWVQELIWVTRQLSPGSEAVIDIEHVHYVDAPGEIALHRLSRLGAGFVAHNPYGVDLCNRLELRRVDAAKSDAQAKNTKSKEAAMSVGGSHAGRSRGKRGH